MRDANATKKRSATGARRGARPGRRMVRDRVVELIRVRAGELTPNPANWRRHPERQRSALRGLLREIGYADALLARRDGGSLVLIDGHLRQSLNPDQVVPVLVLDVTAEEADTLLVTLDPLAALAVPDPPALAALLERVHASNQAVAELLAGLVRQAGLPRVRPLADPRRSRPFPRPPGPSAATCGSLGSTVSCAVTRRVKRTSPV